MVPFSLVSARVHVAMIGAAVGQPVDQPRVAVETEDDRLVGDIQRVEIPVRQSVRMFEVGCSLNAYRKKAGVCEQCADQSPSRGLRYFSPRCPTPPSADTEARAIRRCSRQEVRRHDAKEFARGDHLGLLPKFRKMTRIAGH